MAGMAGGAKWSPEQMAGQAQTLVGLANLDPVGEGHGAKPLWETSASVGLLMSSWATVCAIAAQTPRRLAGTHWDTREANRLDKLIARRWFWSTHSAWRNHIRQVEEADPLYRAKIIDRIHDDWPRWTVPPETWAEVSRLSEHGQYVCTTLGARPLASVGATVMWHHDMVHLMTAARGLAGATLMQYMRNPDGVYGTQRDTYRVLRACSDVLHGALRLREQVEKYRAMTG